MRIVVLLCLLTSTIAVATAQSVAPTCRYEKIRYPVGASWKIDACNSCTCVQPDRTAEPYSMCSARLCSKGEITEQLLPGEVPDAPQRAATKAAR